MTVQYVPYASLAQVKAEIKEDTSQAAADDFLMKALRYVTARIRTDRDMDFVPVSDTYLHSAVTAFQDTAWELELSRPLLEVTEVLDSNGNALTVWDKTQANRSTSSIVPWPMNRYPKLKLQALAYNTWQSAATQWQAIGSFYVTGLWGYHTAYDSAYLDSLDTVQDNPLTAAATTITINSLAGRDALYQAPRFSDGQLLKIEDELVLVTHTDSAVDTSITVMRGVCGTTAANHIQGTVISIFQPEPDIVRAATKWVAYLYNRRGAFQKVVYTGAAQIEFPPDMPEEVFNIINGFPRWTKWQVVNDKPLDL